MEVVGVLMSTYNGEKYIRSQLDSIINQTGCEIKLLVRDDGSSDGTKMILEEYANKGKLSWYTGYNLKPALSFMDLLFHIDHCDYYAFADQDDLWDNDKLLAAITVLKKQDGPAFYHSNAMLANADGFATGKYLHKNNPKLNFFLLACSGGILGCTMVFNHKLREIVVSSPFPKCIRMHDYYVGMICLGCGGTELYDKNSHILYRQHGNNVLGVAIDIKSKIKNKIKQFIKKEKYSISDQAMEIIDFHGNELLPEYKKQCQRIVDYKKNIINTVRVAFSPLAHYSSIKNGLFIRACLLFRRR